MRSEVNLIAVLILGAAGHGLCQLLLSPPAFFASLFEWPRSILVVDAVMLPRAAINPISPSLNLQLVRECWPILQSSPFGLRWR